MQTLLAHPSTQDNIKSTQQQQKKISLKIGAQREEGKPLRIFTILYKKSPEAVK